MIGYSQKIEVNTLNGGFVEFIKLPSNCKVIRKISFATDLYHSINSSVYPITYQNIIRNYVKILKNIMIGNISFAINNANEYIIFDYALYLTQRTKFGIAEIRERNNFEVILASPLNYVVDIYAPYIQNSICKLAFKYNDIIQELKFQGILPDGTSLYKDLPEKFNIQLILNYENG
jgi:hypothetical protein